MISTELGFIHRFEAGMVDGRPLLLLHGTGGDENVLLPLGRSVASGSALLSPRGQVLEKGQARFFRRFTEGVLDEDDVRRRAVELADFVEAARIIYKLSAPIAVGFSNGANIAAAMLFLRPAALAGAALLRPMMPLVNPPKAALGGKSILIVSAKGDAIIPAGDNERLANRFKESGALVREESLSGTGHNLSEIDETIVRAWISPLVALCQAKI